MPTGERSYQDTVTLSGRLSMRYAHDGKPKSVQGKFLWSQARTTTQIELYSPLGQTIARIAIAPGRATLEPARGDLRVAADADALIEEVLGWSLPVGGLRYWMQGFVRSGERMLEAVRPGGPQAFSSNGWQIRVVDWQQAGAVAVPKRIDLERSETMALRIVIDEWRAE